MKISIITAVFNGVETIEACIKSVLSQSYKNIEHVIIDGGSTDGTLDIINKYREGISYWVSESDNGTYDAMNKGIMVATGEMVGILNSDDMYADEFVIENVVKCVSENQSDTCYGDLSYVDKDDANKIIRYWKSGKYLKKNFKKGWMPPHPTFFVKKAVFEKYGGFNTALPVAADYELMLRFLYKYEITTIYIPKVLVKMRTGGISKPGLVNTAKVIVENYKAWKINDLTSSPITFILKPLTKVFQYIDS